MRRRGRFKAIAGLGACFAIACGGSAQDKGGTDPTTAHLTPRVWQVTGVMTPTGDSTGQPVPSGVSLTYFLDLTRAAEAQDFPAKVITDGGVTNVTVHPVAGGIELDYLGGSPSLVSMPDTYTLRFVDSDHDGEIDTLSGSANSTYSSGGGDVVYTVPVDVALTGVPDTATPTTVPPQGAIDPLDGVIVGTSKPMQQLSLSLTGPSTVELTGDTVDARTTAQILPLGSTWTIAGSGVDFGGNALSVSGTVQTIDDPGAVAQVDFETGIGGFAIFPPTLVSSVGSIPAIDGKQSALMRNAQDVTFHLASTEPAKTLSFSVRILATATDSSTGPALGISLGFIGDQPLEVSDQVASVSAASTEDTGDTAWPKATAVQNVSITLTNPGSKRDLLVRVYPLSRSYSVGSPSRALLLDDLKLE